MCGLYGVLSYGNRINDIAGITEALAIESAVRGTDATGIAYNHSGKLNIFKRSKSAYVFNFDVPKNTAAVMGHTRNATQGTLKFNDNNHPFCGRCGKTTFALAHNGILCNDRTLRRELKLPKTKIETDSYIAVQLIESKKNFGFDSIRYMAENIEGSFSFSILDDCGNMYLIKGDSPITLLHFPSKSVSIRGFAPSFNVSVADCTATEKSKWNPPPIEAGGHLTFSYIYASTLSILWKALVDTELFCELRAGKYKEIDIDDGEILKITAYGKIKREKFKYDAASSYGLDWRRGFRYDDYMSNDYAEELKIIAPYFGYTEDDINTLLNEGYIPEEIEEILYG